MAYLSRAKLEFEAFCYFITYTTEHSMHIAYLIVNVNA